jgi:ABC-type sulfate transport system substrate-binding protein
VLKDLLRAVAVFAAGGRRALEDFATRSQGEVLQIARQIGGR